MSQIIYTDPVFKVNDTVWFVGGGQGLIQSSIEYLICYPDGRVLYKVNGYTGFFKSEQLSVTQATAEKKLTLN